MARAVSLSLCFVLSLPAADPALTIYNQEFAVIRETLPLQLQPGANRVQFPDATSFLEPESVILRDPTGKNDFKIPEQNYRADPISQELLLSLYEGKSIDFVNGVEANGSPHIITAKVIRSGYNPISSRIVMDEGSYLASIDKQPLFEVNGKLQFWMPGQPIFPALTDDSILKPTLDWTIHSRTAAQLDAELSYVTRGMTWSADYNMVAPASGDDVDVAGWVTLTNQSGKIFEHARIKLMAGNVNKVSPNRFSRTDGTHLGTGGVIGELVAPVVTQRAFDDYHLYDLPGHTTLRDRETKQVEFLRAANIHSKRLYVYDGSVADSNGFGDLRQARDYGTQATPYVKIVREFRNSEANHLGMPLPRGRVRFYRRDQDGQLEFTGENEIDYTAKNETVRVYTGEAPDIRGERKQVSYNYAQDFSHGSVDESFEIRLRNHKAEPATVQVVEHLYRWANWTITQESDTHRQTDSRTVEFEAALQPEQEKVITYTAHYSW